MSNSDLKAILLMISALFTCVAMGGLLEKSIHKCEITKEQKSIVIDSVLTVNIELLQAISKARKGLEEQSLKLDIKRIHLKRLKDSILFVKYREVSKRPVIKKETNYIKQIEILNQY